MQHWNFVYLGRKILAYLPPLELPSSTLSSSSRCGLISKVPTVFCQDFHCFVIFSFMEQWMVWNSYL